jgi:hypothetical protein
LHFTFRHEFVDKRDEIVNRWKELGLSEFTDYFVKEWLSGKFTDWQIFHTPPGYASTSNPVESFNAKVKDLFTKRDRLTVDSFVEMAIDDLIPFYSLINKRPFLFYNTPNLACREKAEELDSNKFVGQKEDMVVYYHGKTNVYEINFDLNRCTCRWYLAYAICCHIVKACMIYGHELYNAVTTRPYTTRSKRGAKPKNPPASQYLRISTVPEAPIEGMLLIENKANKRKLVDINENSDEQLQPKKRGPKPLSEEEKAKRKAANDAEKSKIKALKLAEKEELKSQKAVLKEAARAAKPPNPVGRPRKATKALDDQ